MPDSYQQAFAAMASPTAIADRNGRLVDVNPAFADAVGHPVAKLVGARASSILSGLPADLSERHESPVEARPVEGLAACLVCAVAPLPGNGGAVLTLRPAPELAGWPYHVIVEAIEEGITIRAADGRILGSNRAARAMFGSVKNPRFVRPDGAPLPPADHPAMMALETGNPVAAVIGIKGSHGNVRWIQVNSVPIEHPEAGRAVVSSFADINRLVETQRLLAESDRRFRAMFDHTFEFIGLLDPQGRLIHANATALSFVDAHLSDLVGKHFAETPWWTHSPSDQQRLRDGIDRAAKGEFVRFECTHPSADGEVAIIDFSLRPVMDENGTITFLIPEGRDITHLKHAEEAMRAAKLEAEAANRAKSAFLASTSHELRTPLNAVIGFSETIMAEVFGPLGNARYAEYVQLIHSAGSHLRDIIEDILDVARIEMGEVVLQEEPVDLRQALGGVVRLLAPKAEERHIALSLDVPKALPHLYADPLRIRQIVMNLLSNAIKFTPSNGRVRVAAGLSNGRLALSVTDTGIGIRPEDMEDIWKPFVQADASLARRFSGNGLGLPIVHHYVQAHGGTVHVDSTPGKGSIFTVLMPANRLRMAANDVNSQDKASQPR